MSAIGTEGRFLVVAGDVGTADSLLSVVPAGSPVELLLLDAGGSEEDAARLPVDRVVLVEGASFGDDPAVVFAGIRPLVTNEDVVVLDSSQPSRDLAGYLTALLDLPLVWAIDGLRENGDGLEADRVVLGGSHRLVHRLPEGKGAVVMAKPVELASRSGRPRGGAASIERHRVTDAPVARVRVTAGGAASTTDGVPLAAARVVISIGRGIGGPENVARFRELAVGVGAALGASRVAVDSGWVPFLHQVGQTGTAVAPDLYVAFGISGAIQHLAGMRGSQRVVAVNTDKEAPICRVADLVIEADANDVAEALLKRLATAAV